MKNIMFGCVLAYFRQYYFPWGTCHAMFPRTKFQIKINIVHVTFFQYVWVKPNWSILTNVENLTNNFGQSVQIYCREKEQEVGDNLSACVLNLLL